MERAKMMGFLSLFALTTPTMPKDAKRMGRIKKHKKSGGGRISILTSPKLPKRATSKLPNFQTAQYKAKSSEKAGFIKWSQKNNRDF